MEIDGVGAQSLMSVSIAVRSTADIGAVRRAAKQVARKIGFDDMALNKLDIAVAELAANLAVHHTIDGEIVVTEVTDHLGKGIEIVAQDRGPGIPDVKRALEDHYSTGGSMGCGLGMVRRQMDEFDIFSHLPPTDSDPFHNPSEPCGTVVTARKWLVNRQIPRRFIYSGYSRPLPGETANGDAFLVTEERDSLFIAVADGLGHGPNAEKASRKAMKFVRDNRSMPFEPLLTELHKTLRKTRGIALTLLRVRLSDRTLIHVGIGNVEARIYPRGRSCPIPRGGILGRGALPQLKITKIPWPGNATLVVFTDGISGRWDLSETPDLLDHHTTTLSHLLVQKHARPTDDATVVVVKEVTS